MLGNGSKLNDGLYAIYSDAKKREMFEHVMVSAIQERFGIVIADSSTQITEGSSILLIKLEKLLRNRFTFGKSS